MGKFWPRRGSLNPLAFLPKKNPPHVLLGSLGPLQRFQHEPHYWKLYTYGGKHWKQFEGGYRKASLSRRNFANWCIREDRKYLPFCRSTTSQELVFVAQIVWSRLQLYLCARCWTQISPEWMVNPFTTKKEDIFGIVYHCWNSHTLEITTTFLAKTTSPKRFAIVFHSCT